MLGLQDMLDEREPVLVAHSIEYGLSCPTFEHERNVITAVFLHKELEEYVECVFIPQVAQVFPEVRKKFLITFL